MLTIRNIPVPEQPVAREGNRADNDWYRYWKSTDGAVRELQTAFPVTSGAVGVGNLTPGLTFGGANVGMTFGPTNGGRYYVFGPVVFFWLQLVLTAKGASVGASAITGLPFPNSAETWGGAPTAVAMQNMTAGVGDTMCRALFQVGGSSIIPAKVVAGTGAYATLTDADFANNSQIRIQGTYYTAP